MGEKMHKITMTNFQMQTLQDAFEHFLIFISLDTALLEIDEKTIEDFIIHLKTNTKASDITINSYLRSLRTFLYYCCESLSYLVYFCGDSLAPQSG